MNTDFSSLFFELLKNLIWAFLCFVFRASFKKDAITSSGQYSRRVIVRQFYICLVLLVVFVSVFMLVDAETPFSLFGFVKAVSGLGAALSLLFLLGAFDAALEYPWSEDKLVHGKRDDAPEDFPQRERKR